MEIGSASHALPPPSQGASPNHSPRAGAWRQSSLLTLSTLSCVVLLLALGNRGSLLVQELCSPVTLNGIEPFVLLLIATFSALIVHEFGHLVAAVACRFEVLAIAFGACRFTRVGSGWRVQGRTKRVFTGSVTAIPRTNEFWRRRMMIVIAAGPAATFAAAVFAALVLYHVHPIEILSLFLRDFFQVNFLIFTLGLIPNASNSTAQNDAGLFLSLYKDGTESNAIFLYHLVLQHQRAGLEPREFPLWLVELMATFEGRADFMVLYAGMLASWAFDRGDHGSGDLWDSRALSLSSRANPATRSACLANSACFDIVFRKDVTSAKSKLDSIQVDMITSPSLRHCALAARDLVRGHVAKSLAEVAASRSFIPAKLQGRGFDCFLLKRLHASATSWSVPVVLA